MPRRSTRKEEEEVAAPSVPFNKVVQVYKRKRTVGEKDRENDKEKDKENDPTAANAQPTLPQPSTTKKSKKNNAQKSKNNEEKEEKEKEEKRASKAEGKNEVEKAKHKKPKTNANDNKTNAQLSDFLKAQEEYFKSVDEFELTVVEEQPLETREPLLLPERPGSPFLKELLMQEFHRKEQELKLAHEQRLRQQQLNEDPDYDVDANMASPSQANEEEASECDVFGEEDYETLVEELDAELSYLHTSKQPKPMPRRTAPPQPRASRVETTAPPVLHNPPEFEYETYKIVVGLVGTPMSFEEFMSRQKAQFS